MAKVILDIETAGVDFDSLDEASKGYLLKYAETQEEEEELKDHLGFWPLTGEIIAIGLLNPDTMKGVIYFQAPGQTIEPFEVEGIRFETGTEPEIIERFWEVIKRYDQFITFNGRTFDCPYIMIRSAILGIKPTKNLMPYRYDDTIHIDLLDQLTFYGAMKKRFNLHMWCRAFGIKSPKEDGVTGDDVKDLYNKKRYIEIARYCLGDLVATKELYERWNKFLVVGGM